MVSTTLGCASTGARRKGFLSAGRSCPARRNPTREGAESRTKLSAFGDRQKVRSVSDASWTPRTHEAIFKRRPPEGPQKGHDEPTKPFGAGHEHRSPIEAPGPGGGRLSSPDAASEKTLEERAVMALSQEAPAAPRWGPAASGRGRGAHSRLPDRHRTPARARRLPAPGRGAQAAAAGERGAPRADRHRVIRPVRPRIRGSKT